MGDISGNYGYKYNDDTGVGLSVQDNILSAGHILKINNISNLVMMLPRTPISQMISNNDKELLLQASLMLKHKFFMVTNTCLRFCDQRCWDLPTLQGSSIN
ncbi:hypothetical protein ACJX0J_015207 [Zea mays]